MAQLRRRKKTLPLSQKSARYWARMAENFFWFRPWKNLLKWRSPHAQWFVGGKTNISFNALDIHLDTERRNAAALIWEGERGETRTLTYLQLHREVCRLASALQALGVKKGDTVAIYMGLVPEAVVAMLACARIGAPHNVIFAGFSPEAVRERVNDSQAKILIATDGVYRRGKHLNLKESVDEALRGTPSITHTIVFKHTGEPVTMKPKRDLWWHELLLSADPSTPATPLDAEHPLFYLYTSGSTGKPKGIFHTTGGYMVQVGTSFRTIFNTSPRDVYWCTADIGWVTGHSYVVYGPLMSGATVFLYEGALNFPDWGRTWDMIERHRISILYTAPTAIRSFIRAGDAWVNGHDLSSLRLLGSVGEPINPEVWKWYHRIVGKGQCPIVDTWWQTETGAIMIAPIPGKTPLTPGSATLPLPGISVDIVREDGTLCPKNEAGYLVITEPWPSMLRTILGEDARYRETYWSKFPGMYFTGDAAKRDSKGNIWIIGRVDDVVNVSGHRIGTAEIESALVSHPSVAESAIIARPDEITGSALVAFVTLKSGILSSPEMGEELRIFVAKKIGSIARPHEVRFTDGLPKTRSGKIMRRILRDLAQQKEFMGDVTTLEDIAIIERLRSMESDESSA